MDDPVDEKKMSLPTLKEVVAENNPWTKGLSRLATAVALPMLGVIWWMTQTGVQSIIHVLEDHGAKISKIQESVSAGQATNTGTHYELKAFRAETTAAREQTAQRLELIEKQVKEIEPRIKEIEQRVKGQ